MMTLPKFSALALCGCLLLSACDTKNDPQIPETPETPQTPEVKVEPKAVVEGKKLVSYPAELIPASGLVDLDTITEVAASVFEGQTALKGVKAPVLQTIGDKAFRGASALMSLELGSAVPPQTHATAFAETPATKGLIVPEAHVDAYLDWALAHGFATINGVALSDFRLAYDEQGVLLRFPDRLISAAGEVVLPAEVKSIPQSFFYGKEVITSVVAPGVTSIGTKAFQSCTKLTKVSFPSLTGEIPAHAFAGCSLLVEVTVGDGVTGALSDAFEGTPDSKKLYIDPMVDRVRHETWAIARGFSLLNDVAIELERPGGLPEGFHAEGRTITRAPQIPSDMKSLVIPKYYQVLGENCIYDLNRAGSYLLSISGEGIKRIEKRALEQQTNIKTIDFPKLEYIGEYGMYTPSALTRVELPECIEIGKEAFAAGSQSELKAIILPKLQKWGRSAFRAHSKVEFVRLGATPPTVDFNNYNPPIGVRNATTKPILEVPTGSKAAYEAWDARKFFGEIREY